MVSNSITSFIEVNSSEFDESTNIPIERNEFKTIFEVLQKDEIRREISACLEDLKAKASSSTIKSTSLSNEYREEGNRLFRANKKNNALAASRCYTNAILAAPEDSPVLALAHANRAAALVEFGYFFDAYCDCELALKLGYPEENHDKILMRQAYCSVKLKNYFKLEDAIEKLKDMQLSELFAKQRDVFEEHLKTIAELPRSLHQDDPHDYKVQNILLHPEKGRYMTAWKDYYKDDVILSEKAFAFVPVKNSKICSYCARQQFIPYPCYSCSKVLYCSQYCKLAHEKIHQYECLGYQCDLYESLSVTHWALHALIHGLPEILNELTNCTSAEEMWTQIETLSKSRKKGYIEVLSLYNNIHLHDAKTIGALALGSIVGAEYLVSCTKFPELYHKSSCSSLDWLIVIASLIFRHAGQMIANAQSSVAIVFLDKFYEFVALDDIWNEPQHLRKGLLHGFRGIDVSFAGIYPFLSLCNHSCEPSVRLNFDGNRVIAKARNAIKKGDEIFNSYVLDCKNSPRSDRSDELTSLYHFQCDCKHCAPNNNDQEYLKFHKYLCGNCHEFFSPSSNNLRWWIDTDEDDDIVVKCSWCATDLDVEWFVEFDKLFKVDNFQSTQLSEALKLFKYSEQVAYGTEMRSYMAFKIVTSFFEMWKDELIEEKFLTEIAEVLRHWLDQVEQQNGVESILYATTSTFALDLMAKGKCFDFDTTRIRKSFDMLSTELRIIFENYVKDYIGEEFDGIELDL